MYTWVALWALLAQPTPREELLLDSWQQHQQMAARSPFRGLPWRSVGPQIQGGRLVDIEVMPGEPYHFLIAYASGGIWRTRNNGVTFEPLFQHQSTMIIGDIALDPSNPRQLWVGTGENNSSRSSYGGLGVFRSTDGGDTWTHKGLTDTDRIGRILVDPRDGDRVLVAALGPLYTSGGQRGIFQTTDGGDSWSQVLAGNATTGFIDLVRDPSDPDVVYAAAWERTRRPWNFVEGGEGSGLWRSSDGGNTWTQLGGGFPSGPHVGRIGLAVAASQPRTVYAFLDNQELLPEEEWDLGAAAITPKRLRRMTKEEFLGQDPDDVESFLRSNDLDPELDADALIERIKSDELTLEDLIKACSDANSSLFDTDVRGAEVWRSDDAGASWRRTHEEPLRQVVHTYGYYFGQIRVAPDDPDRVYILGVPLLTSDDGGRTFHGRNAPNVHVDHQSLWIDPAFPDRILNGNDGGLNMSFDGGRSWLKLNANSVGQFYTVAVDMEEPYNIYGGLQDNGVLKGPSTWREGVSGSWTRVGGGDGMYVQIDERDNSTVLWGFQFGNYFRVGPGGRQKVKPRNALQEDALRYNWNTPILLSAHNQDILYFGANRLFRSMDQGTTFEPISPDLTRSAERGDVPFATITTIAESPQVFGVLWVGTDDGHVHVSQDGGVEWTEVSAGLPADRWVSRVEASRLDPAVAYLSLNGYRDDDVTAYVYRTEDSGASWQLLAAGLPAEAVNVIREDPVNHEVLYVGTDRGAYVSLDRGASWELLAGGLPSVPVHDLVVHPRERELVAGTHGRSIWVLDVLPLQELDSEVRAAAVQLFALEEVKYQRSWRQRRSPWFRREETEPFRRIPFWSRDGGDVVLSFHDEDGRLLRSETVESVAGMNQWQFDLLLDADLALAAEAERLQEEAAEREAGDEEAEEDGEGEEEAASGPTAKDRPWAQAIELERPLYITPGDYEVRITAGEESHETELKVKPPEELEPRVKPEPAIRGEKKDKRS